jgi:hypothetical protein
MFCSKQYWMVLHTLNFQVYLIKNLNEVLTNHFLNLGNQAEAEYWDLKRQEAEDMLYEMIEKKNVTSRLTEKQSL